MEYRWGRAEFHSNFSKRLRQTSLCSSRKTGTKPTLKPRYRRGPGFLLWSVSKRRRGHARLAYSSILRLTTPPLWRNWSWRCRQLPADYHAIAFATAFLARNSMSEPGGFAGLARYWNFFVHCPLAHKPRTGASVGTTLTVHDIAHEERVYLTTFISYCACAGSRRISPQQLSTVGSHHSSMPSA